MTTFNILLLAATYGFVVVILVVILLASTVRPASRITAALLASALMLTGYWSAGELRGWASDAALPRLFQLHWFRIVEPNMLTEYPGQIYLWLEALDEHNYPSGFPRAYEVPYDEALVHKLTTAQTQLAQGEDVAGRISDEDPAADTPTRLAKKIAAETRIGQQGEGGSTGQRVQALDFGNLTFGRLPAPVTPPKI
ncbi:hypothetical protein [Devosia sp. A369]